MCRPMPEASGGFCGCPLAATSHRSVTVWRSSCVRRNCLILRNLPPVCVQRPMADAMLVREGGIVAVGTLRDAHAALASAGGRTSGDVASYNMQGAFLMPVRPVGRGGLGGGAHLGIVHCTAHSISSWRQSRLQDPGVAAPPPALHAWQNTKGHWRQRARCHSHTHLQQATLNGLQPRSPPLSPRFPAHQRGMLFLPAARRPPRALWTRTSTSSLPAST